MRGRFTKYYFIVTAIAALYAVGMGIDMSFGDGHHDVYCDFEVVAERAYLETRWGPCRPRIGRIVSVFGTIFLVLLACFWLPVGLFLLIRREHRARQQVPGVVTVEGSDASNGKWASKSESLHPDRIADKIEHWAGPFSAGYIAVSAFWAFQYTGFAAWVYLLHNAGASFCEYDNIAKSGDFYSSGGLCYIQWTHWLTIWFVLFFITAAKLQVPPLLLGMFCVARRIARAWGNRSE